MHQHASLVMQLHGSSLLRTAEFVAKMSRFELMTRTEAADRNERSFVDAEPHPLAVGPAARTVARAGRGRPEPAPRRSGVGRARPVLGLVERFDIEPSSDFSAK